MFCLELQRLLKSIYLLTRKGRQLILGEEQQNAFDKIKRRLQKTTILHLPKNKGRFHLYSDIRNFPTEMLYKIENGKSKFIAYVSKRLPESAQNYSITELKLSGLAINIASFEN